jgi:hypothetical protein
MAVKNPFKTLTCALKDCGVVFYPANGHQKYHSKQCSNKAYKEQVRLHSRLKLKDDQPPPKPTMPHYNHSHIQKAPPVVMARIINEILAGRAFFAVGKSLRPNYVSKAQHAL